VALGVLGTLAVSGLISGAQARATALAPPAKVIVRANEFRFAVSRPRVAVGPTVFTVRNTGSIVHDFVIAGKKTRILQPGEQQRKSSSRSRGTISSSAACPATATPE